MGLCCIVSKLIQLGLNQIWCSNFSLQRISRKKHRSIWKCKLPVVLCCHYSWDSIEAWNQWRYSITVSEICTRALIYSEIADSAHCVLSGAEEQVKQVKQLLHRKSEAEKLIFWGRKCKRISNIRGCFTWNYTVPTPLLIIEICNNIGILQNWQDYILNPL